MARRIGIAVIVVVAVIGLVVTAALAWASSPAGTRFIAQQLRVGLQRQLGVDALFTELDLGLLPPRVGIFGIHVQAPAWGLYCRAEEAEFSPEPLALLSGVFEVREIYLGSPDCVAEVGELEIDELLAEGDDGDGRVPVPLARFTRFGAIALSEGNFAVRIHDPGRLGEVEVSVEGIGLDLTGGEAAEARVLIGRSAVNWTDGDKTVAEALLGIELRAQIASDAIDIRHLNLRAEGAELHARDAHLPLPLWPKGMDVAELTLRVQLEDLARLPLGLPCMTGEASFIGEASVSRGAQGENLVFAKGRATLEQARVDDFVIGTLAAKFNLAPEGISIEEARLEAAGGVLDLSGHMAFDETLTTTVDLRLDDIELAALLEQVTVSDAYVMQHMTGPMHLSGTLTPLRLAGNVDIDVRDHTVFSDSFRAMAPPRVLYVPKVRVRGQVELTERTLIGTGLSAEFGSTRLAIGMRFDFDSPPTYDIDARSADFHMEDVRTVAGLEFRGHGPLHCRISGVLWDPKITAEVSMEGFGIESFSFDRVSTKVEYSDFVLAFPGAHVEWDHSGASTQDFIIDFDAPGGTNIRAQVDSERVEITELADMFGADLSPYGKVAGRVSGQVGVSYKVSRDALELEAAVRHDQLELLGEKFGSGTANLRLDGTGLTLTELTLPKGRGAITVSGTRAHTGGLSFVAVASAVDTTSIDNPLLAKIGLSASAQAFAVVEGTLESPRLKVDLSVGRTLFRGSSYGPSKLELQYSGDLLTARGTLLGGLVELEHGKLDFIKDQFALEAFYRDLDILRLLAVDAGEHRAGLVVTGELGLSGQLAAQPGWTGHVELTQLGASFGQFSFTNEERLSLTAKAGVFSVTQARLKGQDISLELGGTFTQEEMNLSLEGQAQLRRLSSLVDALESADGDLLFSVSARGPFDAPTLRGAASVRGARAAFVGVPHPFEQISADIAMSPKVIRLTEASAKFAGGTVGLEGELRLSGTNVDGYWFRAQADEISPMIIENLQLSVSTSQAGIVLRSPRQPGELPTVTGDLEVEELKYTQDIRVLELQDLNVDRLSGKQVSTKRALLYDQAGDFVSFDVRLHGDRNLLARNNLFDADLAIDDVYNPLRIVGTNQRFGLLGRLRSRSGLVRFAGKSFEVQSASVDFNDPTRPDNPRFRVVADGQIRDWKVTLTADGTVDDYEIKLSSQPYLSKEDIVFLVLTGLTKAENRQFGGNALSLGAPVLGQLGPGGNTIPAEVQVYSAYSEKAGTDTTRLALGRWLNEDIWVSLSSSVGAERDVSANVDYKINDWFSVMSGYENDNEGQVGNVGLDLKFRLEF